MSEQTETLTQKEDVQLPFLDRGERALLKLVGTTLLAGEEVLESDDARGEVVETLSIKRDASPSNKDNAAVGACDTTVTARLAIDEDSHHTLSLSQQGLQPVDLKPLVDTLLQAGGPGVTSHSESFALNAEPSAQDNSLKSVALDFDSTAWLRMTAGLGAKLRETQPSPSNVTVQHTVVSHPQQITTVHVSER